MVGIAILSNTDIYAMEKIIVAVADPWPPYIDLAPRRLVWI